MYSNVGETATVVGMKFFVMYRLLTYSNAASVCQWKILQWARSEGFSWDDRSSSATIRSYFIDCEVRTAPGTSTPSRKLGYGFPITDENLSILNA